MKKTKVRKHKRRLKWRTTTVKRHKRRKKKRVKKRLTVRGRLADRAALARTYSEGYEGDTLLLPKGHSRNINLTANRIINPFLLKPSLEERERLNEEIEYRKTLKDDLPLIETELRRWK